MMSNESEKTEKTEKDKGSGKSLFDYALICCGALFTTSCSCFYKLLEFEQDSWQFYYMSVALVISLFLFTLSCGIVGFKFKDKMRSSGKDATCGGTSVASVFISADLNSGIGSEHLDELVQLQKERLKSEIRMRKAVTRYAKAARRLILVVTFWGCTDELLVISSTDSNGHAMR